MIFSSTSMLMNLQGIDRIRHLIPWIWLSLMKSIWSMRLYQPGLGLSDHVCLNFNYLCYVEKCDRPIPRFNLYRAGFNQLNNLLHSVAWEEALRDLDVDSAWGYLSSLFNTFMEECIPMSVPKRRKNLYITREAKFLKNTCNRLWRRYATSKSHSDYLAYT